jgi:hypothetical protein
VRLFILLLLFCFIISPCSYGQGPEDNVFTYSDRVGTNTGNSALLGRNNDGSVLFWPYQGQIQVLGSNSVKPYTIPAGIKIHTGNFSRTGENLEWVISGPHAYLLSNNIIVDSLDAGGEIQQSTTSIHQGAILWFTYRIGSSIMVAYYKHKKIIRLGESPFKLTNYHSLITLKDGRGVSGHGFPLLLVK